MMPLLPLIFTLAIGLATPGYANGANPITSLTTADAIEIHAVVQHQLEAFAKDDADGAFELTTPAKRLQIGSSDKFLRMIKDEYNPIYRYVGLIFSAPEVVNGDAVQTVRVTDRDGHVWLAIFWMQQLDDSSWKIDGCQLFETDSVST